MSSIHLVIDATNICYRNFFAVSKVITLDAEETHTIIPFRFFQDIMKWKEMFNSDKFYFCFDAGTSKRKKVYPDYKLHRKVEEEVEKKKREKLFIAIHSLSNSYLGRIGYNNIYSEDGYEADDLIASICKTIRKKYPEDKIQIISGDKDLYQLINHHISVHGGNANTPQMTLDSFFDKYGLSPTEWPIVKAIAGCVSDNIKGVDGVGEKTAIKYIQHKFRSKSNKFMGIGNSLNLIESNLKLVTLPYEGTPKLKIHKDELTPVKWNAVMKELGFSKLCIMSSIGVK